MVGIVLVGLLVGNAASKTEFSTSNGELSTELISESMLLIAQCGYAKTTKTEVSSIGMT